MGIQSGTAWLKESFVRKVNFVQKWHLFWTSGVIYLDAFFVVAQTKLWLFVRFLSCEKLEH